MEFLVKLGLWISLTSKISAPVTSQRAAESAKRVKHREMVQRVNLQKKKKKMRRNSDIYFIFSFLFSLFQLRASYYFI